MRCKSLSRTGRALLVVLLVAAPVFAVAASVLTELPLEDGGIQKLLYAEPTHPQGTLIMLAGGSGMVEFNPDGSFRRMGESFLLRTLPLWQSQGFATAVLSPPNGMSLLGYRHTVVYAGYIGQAIDWVRRHGSTPVWLVGISQGATAAVGAAARLGDRVAGIVVLSPVTGGSSAGETVFDGEPGRVGVPVLIVVNKNDTCPASPPGSAGLIVDAFAHAPQREVVYLESTAIQGQACNAEAPHSFFGIEPTTVERIAAWMTARSSR